MEDIDTSRWSDYLEHCKRLQVRPRPKDYIIWLEEQS